MQTRQLSFTAALLFSFSLAGCLGDGTLDDVADCAATGQELLAIHCLGCHSSALGDGQRGGAPRGLDFDTDDDVRRHESAIRSAAIDGGAMPPGRPLQACEREALDAHLVALREGSCVPSCEGRRCGDDGCGGVCGVCDEDELCDEGRCVDGGTLSYERDVMPIWRHHGCASAGCHGSAGPSEGLDLSTAASGYAGLVDRPSRQCRGMELVDPGDAEDSYLMNKLLGVGMCSGTRMPRGGRLTADQIDVVRAWIEGGAER